MHPASLFIPGFSDYTTPSSGTGGSDPSSILGSDLVAWYRSEDVTGTTIVSSWTDRTTNANNLSSPSGQEPSSSTTLDGYKVIKFDGSKMMFANNSTSLNIGDGNKNLTLVCVIKVNAMNNLASFVSKDNTTSPTRNQYRLDARSNGSGGYAYSDGSNWNDTTTPSGYFISGVWHTYELSVVGSTNVVQFYRGATLIAQSTRSSSFSPLSGTGKFYLGYTSPNNSFVNADYLEVLVIKNVLSSSQRSSLGNYFKARYPSVS